jgi:hypothetical protein
MLIFVTMYRNRSAIITLGEKLQEHSQNRGTALSMTQVAKSKRSRASFTGLVVELQWLIPKFEQFKTSQWHAGVWLLLLRLLQTSLMALIPSQLEQAAIMCIITLASIGLQVSVRDGHSAKLMWNPART